MNKLLNSLIQAIATAGLAAPAVADEVFDLTFHDTGAYEGELIYETDLQRDAVMIMDNGSTRFYINGLAGQYSGRDIYSGWFIRYLVPHDMAGCGSYATDHQGYQSEHWGRLDMIWYSDEHFTLQLGECNYEFDLFLEGRLRY